MKVVEEHLREGESENEPRKAAIWTTYNRIELNIVFMVCTTIGTRKAEDETGQEYWLRLPMKKMI